MSEDRELDVVVFGAIAVSTYPVPPAVRFIALEQEPVVVAHCRQ